MEETEIVEQTDNTWKVQTLIIGGVLGALVGVGAAFLLTKRAEQKGAPFAITPGKGVQLGVMVAGLLRSILSLGDE
jgi:uncharacterized membrane protein